MHRDRRRAGRAIRKARREMREQLPYRALQGIALFGDAVVEVVEAMACMFKSAGEIIAGTAQTITFVPAPSATPLETEEAGTGRPSHSGVTRASEAHSAAEGVSSK